MKDEVQTTPMAASEKMQGCRHNLEPWASGGSNGVPPYTGHSVLVRIPNDPNDPPETWLDRMARAALETRREQEYESWRDLADDCYDIAAAMLAEKRRREKKEVEE